MEAGAPVCPTERRNSQPAAAGRRTEGGIPRLRVAGVRSPRAAYRAVPGASAFPNPPPRVALTSLEPVAPCNGVGMRIALVTEFYYPHLGGVTEHVHNLALEFRRRGHEVTVVTANMDGQGRDPEFVRRVGTSRIVYSNGSFARVTTGWGLARRVRDLLRERRVGGGDVPGVNTPPPGLLGPSPAPRLGPSPAPPFP